jgi:hypothetical protein
MLKKILLFLWLFIFFLNSSYAFNANLQTNKKNFDINDYINLRLEIISDEWWNIQVSKIKWLENFEILGQSQSQSSSSSFVIINWKTQAKNTTTINLDLTLKAKEKWIFEIWPAILKNSNWEIKTNSIKIKVSQDKIFLNNSNNVNNINNLNLQKNNWKQKQIWNNNFDKEKEKINTFDNVEKKDFNNNILYLFILIIFLSFIWFFWILTQNKKLKERLENESFETKENLDKKEEEINFEEKNIEFPEKNEKNFIEKITKILKEKIYNKYKIENIENKSFEEILEKIPSDENLEELINLLNKAKYSNIITDNKKILDLIKKI